MNRSNFQNELKLVMGGLKSSFANANSISEGINFINVAKPNTSICWKNGLNQH